MTKTAKDHFVNEVAKAELNQYWYSPSTVERLLTEITHHATSCAFLSAPSLFFALDADATDARRAALREHSRLFEQDQRWSADPGFVLYDFNHPDRIPEQYRGAFDFVVADPPFITEDVWRLYIVAAKVLLKDGGKVLFTTILENHNTLERLMDAPLFIARYRPAVRHLTYQYVCFLSYEATTLQEGNAELPPEEPATRAAIDMANDLRQSEHAFAALMQSRNRAGEVPLPVDLPASSSPAPAHDLDLNGLEWSHVPEGLTIYPDGCRGPPPPSEPLDTAVHYGARYATALRLREQLGAFKNSVDSAQKLLGAQLRLRGHRLRLRKELAARTGESQAAAAAGDGVGVAASSSAEARHEMEAALDQAEEDLQRSEEERADLLGTMTTLADKIIEDERCLAGLPETDASGTARGSAASYEAALRECIEAYRNVEIKRAALQELAADATRKYKAPCFGRMASLLREIKEIKKNYASQAEAAAAPAE